MSRTLLRLIATAWVASVGVYLGIAFAVSRDDDALWFFLGAAVAVTVGAVTAHRVVEPRARGMVIGVVAGATLGLAMLGVLSVGVYLLPAVALWCAAASVQAREVGWTVVGPAVVAGLAVTVVGVVAAA
ncbi:MAG: hypothetical protein DWG80_04465 [Chloroflexi bacterium]|nr:hypothetical protein [Chloroflexota bacterium]